LGKGREWERARREGRGEKWKEGGAETEKVTNTE